jgi:putative ABC transport system ATP-binding protein
MMDEIIRLKNVVIMFDSGIRAINDISLNIPAGECVGIYGAPGSGKTTLVRLIAGLDKPSAGQVYVLGEPVHEMEPDTAAEFRNRNIGILSRNPAFLDNLTVLENVAFPLMLRRESTAKRTNAAKEQLKILELNYAAYAHPPQLSPLEKHKAAIARALISQPKLLLLDDFASDITETGEIAETLRTVCRCGDHTVVELTGASKGLIYTERYVILEHGKILEEQK